MKRAKPIDLGGMTREQMVSMSKAMRHLSRQLQGNADRIDRHVRHIDRQTKGLRHEEA